MRSVYRKCKPAAISTTMMAASTQSTAMQKGGHHRVLATKWVRCCQRSFRPWPTKPATSSHGVPVTAAAADENEGERHAALDSDDPHASVGHREPDIDRRDDRQAERVDRRAVEPPEDERRGGLDDADADAPADRRTV